MSALLLQEPADALLHHIFPIAPLAYRQLGTSRPSTFPVWQDTTNDTAAARRRQRLPSPAHDSRSSIGGPFLRMILTDRRAADAIDRRPVISVIYPAVEHGEVCRLEPAGESFGQEDSHCLFFQQLAPDQPIADRQRSVQAKTLAVSLRVLLG